MKLHVIALFAGALLFTGCSSDNDDNATPSGGGGGGGGTGGTTQLTPTTPCSVQMTVNGTAVSVTADFVAYECGTSSGGEASAKEYGGSVVDINNDNDVVRLKFGRFSTGQSVGLPTDSAFLSFFHTGTWPYGDAMAFNVATVSTSEFLGSNYLTYSTAYGDQTGSTFEITQMLPVTSQFFGTSLVVRATFNCKLYSEGGALIKTITNGTAVVHLGNI